VRHVAALIGIFVQMTAQNLGPLSAFTGTYGGMTTSSGMNAIYVPSKNGPVLKLHRIREELKFISEPGLFGVPVNRGTAEDITIVPVLYDQYVADNDVPETGTNLSTGAAVLHQEAGMFLLNPASTVPAERATVQRLGSLPHGVAFNAQGYITTISGAPTIPPMNTADAVRPNGIHPFAAGDPDQLASAPAPSPADAAKFQPNLLADPNSLLRTVLAKQKVVSTIIIATDTHNPQLPGGGVTNSAFTLANAECIRQRSTFFLMKVAGWFGPQDLIMYTQEVLMRMGDVIYPHVTVASLFRDPLPTPILL
jgi:hypothetical protein